MFRGTYTCTKRFTIPSWIPAFKTPTYQYDITPPTYQEITKIIRRMKASGSSCRLDQISIIVFKKCPIFAFIFAACFQKDFFYRTDSLYVEKSSYNSYLQKRRAQNFRPITLETVPLKIYTSFIRNRMYNFLELSNILITCHI